jgi:hypothetical protein
MTMTYNVWITLHGVSAQTAGIVGATQKTRSSWVTGKLEWIPINDGTQQNFQFEETSDESAWVVLNRMFNERNRSNRRTLSGRSYLRHCRQSLKAAKEAVA